MVLRITAPSTYADQPTTISIQSFIGNYYGQSADSAAASWAEQHSFADQNSVTQCPIAGTSAAFARYGVNGMSAYQFFIVRVDTQYQGLARLWGLNLAGTGGLDSRSIADAMSVLGSWQWNG